MVLPISTWDLIFWASRVRQCVGERNYRWFLSFLLTHVMLCAYGTAVASVVLYGIIQDNNLLNATFMFFPLFPFRSLPI